MSKIDYDALEDEFEDLPSHEKKGKPQTAVGSLTDNLRQVKPNRDGARKRNKKFNDE